MELVEPKVLDDAYDLLCELRPMLSLQEYRELYSAARGADGYRLLGAFDGKKCVGLVGARVLHDFVHGRHLYVDDLVVTKAYRGRGIGKALLKETETVALETGCRSLRLSTVLANEGARRFYAREGWVERSIVFKKPVLGVREESK